jgi:hypothetical protein
MFVRVVTITIVLGLGTLVGCKRDQAEAEAPVKDRLTLASVQSLRIEQRAILVDAGEGIMIEKWRTTHPASSMPNARLAERVMVMDVPAQRQAIVDLLDQTCPRHELSEWPGFRSSDPDELQFSCAVTRMTNEESWCYLLECESSDLSAIAAQVLWMGKSNRYARKVLTMASAKADDDAAWQRVHERVEASLSPEMIRQQISSDNRAWGLWLASLRPASDLVPAILAAHAQEPTPYTVYALGSSGDARAYQPLLAALNSGDDQMAGYSAQALGLLGMPEAEEDILAVIEDMGVWAQAKACIALGKIGSDISIPQLTVLSESRDTGAIDVDGCAQRAIEEIRQRQDN